MRLKVLIGCLFLSSFFGYTEWGGGNSMFFFEGEIQILHDFIDNPLSILHPFVVIPLIGQIMLLVLIIQKQPNRILAFVVVGALGLLFGLVLLIGFMNLNVKMILSTIPFLFFSAWVIKIIPSKKETTVHDSAGASEADSKPKKS